MSNQQQVLVEGSESKVNKWFQDRDWLIQYSWDQQFATWEANKRAALAQIISELDRNNLMPLFEVARALALFPIEFGNEAS